MKQKFNLYLAIKGTYDSTTTTVELTPFDFQISTDQKTLNKQVKEIKKLLKFSHVVVEATAFSKQFIKLPYIYVAPKNTVENMSYYRNLVINDAMAHFHYPITLLRANRIETEYEKEKIELIKNMMLEDVIERSE